MNEKNTEQRNVSRVLQARAKHRKWVATLLALAVIVCAGTFWTLRYIGISATYKKKVLDCHAVSGEVSHVHNDDCYLNGELVCPLQEIEPHEHTEACYTAVLFCGLEESAGHVHTDACFVPQMELVCGLEETAGDETHPAHYHTDACYAPVRELICGLEETEGDETHPAHWHTDECYQNVMLQVCGMEEGFGAHYHTDECYSQVLVCEKPALPVHVHGPECFRTEEMTPEEIAAMDLADDSQEDEIIPEGDQLQPEATDAITGDIIEKPTETNSIEGTTNDPSPAPGNTQESVSVPEGNTTPEGVPTDLPMQTEPFRFVSQADNILVTVEAPAEAFPAGTEMKVRAVYDEKVLGEMADAVEGNVVQVQAVDISFWYGGKEIEPMQPIRVVMTPVDVPDFDEQTVVHVDDAGSASVVEQENVSEPEAAFEVDSFSVYGLVYTKIETTVLASDGNNYKITVTAPNENVFPENAKLWASEIMAGGNAYGINYNEYLARTEYALGWEAGTASYVRLFDIFVGDQFGNKLTLTTPVDVKIQLMDKEANTESSVVHFGTKTEVMNAETRGQTVSFEAKSFSIYAIIGKEVDGSVARAKIIFQNTDGTPFEFLNNSGNTVDNQIIRSGSVLEEVGMPSIDVNGQTFQGWYIYDVANNAYTSYQLKFGGTNTWTVSYGDAKSITSNTAVVTSENADAEGCVFYVRPYFGEVSYLTFYNESAGNDTSLGGHGIILNRIQVIDGTTYDISEQQATPPDSIWNETTQTWEPVSYVFIGWSDTAGSDDDNRTAITNTTITVSKNQSFYPIFKQGHWVTFDSAPTGSGATYIPAKIVLSTQTTSVARPAVTPTWEGHTFVGWFSTPEVYDPDNANYRNADGTINPAYNGYFSTNETAAGAYQFNQSLDEDLTLYAHWNVDTANVTVVKWEQVVTDDKNAETPTKEQMGADGYASNTDLKHYEYAGQQNLDETVNSILRNNDGDITIPSGFNLNSTLSDAQVVVKDDGTAVLNLYYDRNLITLNFDRDIETHTQTDATTGTLYGLVNGEYVRITWNGNNWVYTTTEQVTEYVDYTGMRYNTSTNDNDNSPQKYGVYNNRVISVYYHESFFGNHWSRRQDHSWGDDQQYTGPRYVQNANGAYGFVNGEMVQLVNGQYQTTTTQTVEHVYDGNRYTQGTTRSFTGLYGQTLAQNGYEWPSSIGWQYYGYNYSGGSWDGGRTYQMSYLGQFVVPPNRFNGANDTVTTINFSSNSATSKIYYYVQNADGTWPGEGGYIDAGITAAGTIQIAEKFDGFTMDAYEYNNNGHGAEYTANNASWTSVSPGESSKTVNDGMAIRYRRLRYTVKFLDSHDGSELPDVDNVQVMYGASMATAYPGDDITITNANTQYVWDGKWYKDQACTEEFNFDDAMPNHDMAVYAGWNEVWYWVKIDPNGGVLPSTEATWFWEPYGGVAEEYHNITRGYVEDDAGEYYYHVDVFDPATELNQYGTNVRKAEYRLISDNPNWEQDSIDGKRYSVDPNNTYSLVGWYKVNDDGTLEPYNFSSPITDNLTLRALWRVVGEYHVKYSVEGVDSNGDPLYVKDEDGNPTEDRLLGTNAPSDTNKYADKSNSSIMAAATPPSGYTFVGWYYNGHVYNPGDTFIVDADLADENKDIWIYPVYLAIEDQPVETTHIPFVGNGGTTAKENGSDESWAWEVTADQTRINFVNVQPNVTFILEESPTYFTRPGYDFVGWGKRTEGTTTTADNFLTYDQEEGKFYTKAGAEVSGIAADEFKPYEELYALWKIKNYSVTVNKVVNSSNTADQSIPFTFTPDFNATGLPTEYQQNFILTGQETTVTPEEGGSVTYLSRKTFENIPYGTIFSITEGDNNDFEIENVVYSVTGADDITKNVSDQGSSNGAAMTVDGNTVITVTNKPRNADVVVKKELTDTITNNEAKDFSFTASAKLNGEDYDLPPEKSSFTVNSGNAEGFTLSELPIGLVLTITENEADEYTTTVSAEKAEGTQPGTSFTLTVPTGGDTVTFNNKRIVRKISIVKYDFGTGENAHVLENAVFDLKQGNETIYENLASNSEGYLVRSYEEGGVQKTTTVLELPVGEYQLVETSAPAGYNHMPQPLSIKVLSDSDNNKVSYTQTDFNSGAPRFPSPDANNVYLVEAHDNPGVELPQTGGPSAELFEAIGGITMTLAFVVMVIRKRRMA